MSRDELFAQTLEEIERLARRMQALIAQLERELAEAPEPEAPKAAAALRLVR